MQKINKTKNTPQSHKTQQDACTNSIQILESTEATLAYDVALLSVTNPIQHRQEMASKVKLGRSS